MARAPQKLAFKETMSQLISLDISVCGCQVVVRSNNSTVTRFSKTKSPRTTTAAAVSAASASVNNALSDTHLAAVARHIKVTQNTTRSLWEGVPAKWKSKHKKKKKKKPPNNLETEAAMRKGFLF